MRSELAWLHRSQRHCSVFAMMKTTVEKKRNLFRIALVAAVTLTGCQKPQTVCDSVCEGDVYGCTNGAGQDHCQLSRERIKCTCVVSG